MGKMNNSFTLLEEVSVDLEKAAQEVDAFRCSNRKLNKKDLRFAREFLLNCSERIDNAIGKQ